MTRKLLQQSWRIYITEC